MDDHEIGYGKPPKKHQWKKGQSGNPKGRPRKPPHPILIDDAEILRRIDAEEIVVNGRTMARRDAEIRRILSLAIGNNRKARGLLNRLARAVTKSSHRGGVVHAPVEYFTGKSEQ